MQAAEHRLESWHRSLREGRQPKPGPLREAPVQRLRADQYQPRRPVLGARPSGAHADQRQQRRQQLPETHDRLLGKTRIGDADNRQDQHRTIGQLSDPKAYARMREDQRGRYYGVGMVIQQQRDSNGKDHVVVITPYENTPSFRAGIRPGRP